jgi:AP2 domain
MKEIVLANNRGVALVDDEDYAELSKYKWQLLENKARRSHKGYAVRGVYYGKDARGKKVQRSTYMHRQLIPNCDQVDHIDGNGLNNQKSNLRPATGSQNQANRGILSCNKSGYKGVIQRTRGKLEAIVRKNGVVFSLGYFYDPIEAAKAYDKAALVLHGDYARLNFPQPGTNQIQASRR